MLKHDSEFESEFQKQRWALLAHAEAVTALTRAESEHDLIEGVCKAITSTAPYVLAWVGRAERDAKKTVTVLGSYGSEIRYLENIFISWDGNTPDGLGPAGTCIRTNTLVVINDIEENENYAPWRNRARLSGIQSLIGVPISIGEHIPSAGLMVYSCQPHSFGDIEKILFENFAKELGFGLNALNKQKLLQEVIEKKDRAEESLSNSLRATIEAMSKTMEWRDPYTSGHQKRVAMISAAIADKLGWSEEDQQADYLAGLVHDIGKIAVPAEILTKPSKLNHLEMQLVQGHVEAGYHILKDVPFPWPIAEMILQHHERMDGSGYPNKLPSAQILMGARVIAVADTIEAMATHRPYRAALGLNLAMQTIREGAGTIYDQSVVDATFLLLDENRTLEKLLQSSS